MLSNKQYKMVLCLALGVAMLACFQTLSASMVEKQKQQQKPRFIASHKKPTRPELIYEFYETVRSRDVDCYHANDGVVSRAPFYSKFYYRPVCKVCNPLSQPKGGGVGAWEMQKDKNKNQKRRMTPCKVTWGDVMVTVMWLSWTAVYIVMTSKKHIHTKTFCKFISL